MSTINIRDGASTTKLRIPNGVAAAAMLAAGIGCFALGLFTTLAQSIPTVKNALNWWNPVGPLSGKTGMAYALWIISWIVAHQMMKNREVKFRMAYVIGLILIALGLLGTFPTFFEHFGH